MKLVTAGARDRVDHCAARAPFEAAGLRLPWLAVHGNHDQLLQGNTPGNPLLARLAVGSRKPIGLPAELSSPQAVGELIGGLARCDPRALSRLVRAHVRTVSPDPGRRIINTAEFVAAHDGPRARPARHGFGADGLPYYRHDHVTADAVITMLVLDTVNPHGNWQGSIDPTQLDWLRDQLSDADRDKRYVVLCGHHPLNDLINGIAGEDAPPRVLRDELAEALAGHPSLVCSLNGHTHATAITPHDDWWELTAPSLIDWPQQGRIVELTRCRGTLTIATTMVDHAGPAPWTGGLDGPETLAGLSRELAANDWQSRHHRLDLHPSAGRPTDRNALLYLTDPWA